MKTDSICVSWIESENRYLVTILNDEGLIKEYVDTMPEAIKIIEEVENAA